MRSTFHAKRSQLLSMHGLFICQVFLKKFLSARRGHHDAISSLFSKFRHFDSSPQLCGSCSIYKHHDKHHGYRKQWEGKKIQERNIAYFSPHAMYTCANDSRHHIHLLQSKRSTET